MTTLRRLGFVAVGAVTVILLAPTAAGALAVTVPASANLGSVPTGTSSLTAHLGTITATNSGIVAPNVSAQVSCTAFKTGAGTANQTIPCSAISYWSGPATASSGLSSNTPGQPTAAQAVVLSTTRTAFSATGLALSISVSWNPTIIVNIPAAAVAGTYSGTITHSVA
jgi:hypothetical protein